MISLTDQATTRTAASSAGSKLPPQGSGMALPSRSCCVRTSGTIQSTPHSTPTREPTCAGEAAARQALQPLAGRCFEQLPRGAHLHGSHRPRRAHEADEGVNNFKDGGALPKDLVSAQPRTRARPAAQAEARAASAGARFRVPCSRCRPLPSLAVPPRGSGRAHMRAQRRGHCVALRFRTRLSVR